MVKFFQIAVGSNDNENSPREHTGFRPLAGEERTFMPLPDDRYTMLLAQTQFTESFSC